MNSKVEVDEDQQKMLDMVKEAREDFLNRYGQKI